MKRAMKRSKPRDKKKNNHNIKATPKWLDKFEQFDDMDTLFRKLIHGQIVCDIETDRPVMTSSKGHIFDICSALEGWCEYWAALAVRHNYDYDDHALVRLNNKLINKVDLSFKDIQEAIQTVDRQKKIFDQTDRNDISAMSRTIETKLLIEAKQYE